MPEEGALHYPEGFPPFHVIGLQQLLIDGNLCLAIAICPSPIYMLHKDDRRDRLLKKGKVTNNFGGVLLLFVCVCVCAWREMVDQNVFEYHGFVICLCLACGLLHFDDESKTEKGIWTMLTHDLATPDHHP